MGLTDLSSRARVGHRPARPVEVQRLSEVVGGLSQALDLTEGLPAGHSVRSCLIGMRIAEVIGLSSSDRAALFWALLLKDAGCSTNASQLASLTGVDDRALKRADRVTDWSSRRSSAVFLARHVAGSPARRLRRFVTIATSGTQDLIELRCDAGAHIAAMLQVPPGAQAAIRTLDEHWDGRGRPHGLRGEEIPLLGRIIGLAQTFEVFAGQAGVDAAYAMAAERRARWFDPTLVDALVSLRGDLGLWWQVTGHGDLSGALAAVEPHESRIQADESGIDRVAAAFAVVIDAKSPVTARHSERVAAHAVAIGADLGLGAAELRDLRRAGLLHDLGKLAVSSQILDKNGPLTHSERRAVQRHPAVTEDILLQVRPLRNLAVGAAGHHERLDGSGYHRGVPAGTLPRMARILTVADVFEAMTSDRPYRSRLPVDHALSIMAGEVGTAFEPEVFAALRRTLEASPPVAA